MISYLFHYDFQVSSFAIIVTYKVIKNFIKMFIYVYFILANKVIQALTKNYNLYKIIITYTA